MPSFFERRRKCEAVGVGAPCDMTIDVDHQDLHGSKRTAFLRWGSVRGFINLRWPNSAGSATAPSYRGGILTVESVSACLSRAPRNDS